MRWAYVFAIIAATVCSGPSAVADELADGLSSGMTDLVGQAMYEAKNLPARLGGAVAGSIAIPYEMYQDAGRGHTLGTVTLRALGRIGGAEAAAPAAFAYMGMGCALGPITCGIAIIGGGAMVGIGSRLGQDALVASVGRLRSAIGQPKTPVDPSKLAAPADSSNASGGPESWAVLRTKTEVQGRSFETGPEAECTVRTEGQSWHRQFAEAVKQDNGSCSMSYAGPQAEDIHLYNLRCTFRGNQVAWAGMGGQVNHELRLQRVKGYVHSALSNQWTTTFKQYRRCS